MDLIFEGRLSGEEHLKDVLDRITMNEIKGISVLRIAGQFVPQSGRMVFSDCRYIVAAMTKDGMKEGYEAVRTMLSVTMGSYAFIKVDEQDNLDLVANLHIPLDRVIQMLPSLPEDPRALFDEKSLLDRIFTGANAKDAMNGPVQPRDDMNGPVTQSISIPIPVPAPSGTAPPPPKTPVHKTWTGLDAVSFKDASQSGAVGAQPPHASPLPVAGRTSAPERPPANAPLHEGPPVASKAPPVPSAHRAGDSEITQDPLPAVQPSSAPTSTVKPKPDSKEQDPQAKPRAKKERGKSNQPEPSGDSGNWQNNHDGLLHVNESKQTFPELDAEQIRQQSARERNERYVRQSQRPAFRISPLLVVGMIFLIFSAEVAAICNWPKVSAYLKLAASHSSTFGVDSKANERQR